VTESPTRLFRPERISGVACDSNDASVKEEKKRSLFNVQRSFVICGGAFGAVSEEGARSATANDK
jgi:hypothetical protein